MPPLPPPSLIDFTGRLLQHEMEKAGESADLAVAFQRICRALQGRLTPLISSTGFHTLFARAIRLASRDFPSVEAMSATSDCSVHAIPGADDAHASAQSAAALAAILAHFIWLLVTFIGGNLGLGTVRQIWPQVPCDRLDSDSGVDT